VSWNLESIGDIWRNPVFTYLISIAALVALVNFTLALKAQVSIDYFCLARGTFVKYTERTYRYTAIYTCLQERNSRNTTSVVVLWSSEKTTVGPTRTQVMNATTFSTHSTMARHAYVAKLQRWRSRQLDRCDYEHIGLLLPAWIISIPVTAEWSRRSQNIRRQAISFSSGDCLLIWRKQCWEPDTACRPYSQYSSFNQA